MSFDNGLIRSGLDGLGGDAGSMIDGKWWSWMGQRGVSLTARERHQEIWEALIYQSRLLVEKRGVTLDATLNSVNRI